MESNKDEAEKCRAVGLASLRKGDTEKAAKFFERAQRMFPTPDGDLLLQRAKSTAPVTSNDAAEPSVRKRRPSIKRVQTEKEESPSKPYTAEQARLCESVLKAASYYEILGVPKNCTISEVKKSYRKLALQLHPDKNTAPKAEEAFKRVSKAFQCLSDDEKRKQYDQFGEEDQRQTVFTRATHFGDDELTPEELFRAMFGMHFGPRNGRIYRTHVGRAQHGQPTRQQQNIFSVLQLVPLVIILLMFIVGSSELFSWNSGPDFNLQRTSSYPREIKTTRSRVPIFVTDGFDQKYPPNSRARSDIEISAELAYFTTSCRNEHKGLWKDLEYYRQTGNWYRARKVQQEITALQEHSDACQAVFEIQRRYPRLSKPGWNW